MITVFTPSYNRGYIIDKLYHSLQRQTNFNFEWIVIDDDSTDNTSELFAKWVNEANQFPIIYKKQKRGGKHRAQNKALNIAKGEAFFCVDSDDYLLDNAIELANAWFDDIKSRDDICGVSGLRGTDKYNILGGGMVYFPPGEYVDLIHNDNILKKYGLLRDIAAIYKIDVMRKYLMPEFDDELYAPESLFIDKMGLDGYKTRYFNKITYIADYLPDGLTRTGAGWQYRNPKAFVSYINIKEKGNIFDHRTSENKKCGLYFGLICRFGIEYANNKLGILLKQRGNYQAQYNAIVSKMRDFLIEQNVKKVIIYGLGTVGELFIYFFKFFDIPILYGIDKVVKNKLGIVGVSPEKAQFNKSSETIIIVTLADYSDEVTEFLTNCGCKFIYWRDISSEHWDIIKNA